MNFHVSTRRSFLFSLMAVLAFPSVAMEQEIKAIKPEVTSLGFAPERILAIGNSYFYWNCGVTSYLGGLIRQGLNPKIHVRLAAIGHSNMAQHPVEEYLDNSLTRSHDEQLHEKLPENLDALEKRQRESYDLVLLQATNRGLEKQARDAHYFKAHIQAIREHGGAAAIVITWTQKKKNAPALEDVIDAVTKIANENHVMAIPVGQAFANAEKKYPDWKLIMPDKSHPTALGSYLMACVIYASVYKRDPMEATGFKGGCEKPLPEKTRKEAAEVAWQTVQEWFGWNGNIEK